MKGNKSAQVGISALVSLADCATANNTVAIIVSGNVARDMSRQYKVDPRRTASLLDVFSCVFQGLIPWGAQLLLCRQPDHRDQRHRHEPCGIFCPTCGTAGSWPAFGVLSIFIPYADGICRKDPWNWEYDVAESGVAAKKAAMEAAGEKN